MEIYHKFICSTDYVSQSKSASFVVDLLDMLCNQKLVDNNPACLRLKILPAIFYYNFVLQYIQHAEQLIETNASEV